MVVKKDVSDLGLTLKGNKDAGKLLATLQKTYGESFQLGSADRNVEVLSTGSLLLDMATGIGGYPRGRITQISGWESAGKTTHGLWAIAELQKQGGRAALIDTEYALDPQWAMTLGVNMEDLVWIQVEDLETAAEITVEMAESGLFDLIVFDSVAGAPIKDVVEGDIGDSNMGTRARIMSSFMPKLNGPVARNDVWMIFTNQLRDSLKAYAFKPVSPGGHALAFHSSMIIELKGKKIRKSGGDVTHVEITATVEKNKLSAPGRSVTYSMDFDGSINLVAELASVIVAADNAEKLDVERAGSWYTLPQEMMPGVDDRRFQGKEKIQEALAEVEVYEAARKYVLSRI